MVSLQIVMTIPRLHIAVITLHDPHSTFNEAPRDEELARLNRGAISLADRYRLTADIERIGRLRLHSECEFEGLNACLQSGVFGARLLVEAIEFYEEIELPALIVAANRGITNVVNQ